MDKRKCEVNECFMRREHWLMWERWPKHAKKWLNTQWRAKQLEYTFLDDCLPILIRDGLEGLGLV